MDIFKISNDVMEFYNLDDIDHKQPIVVGSGEDKDKDSYKPSAINYHLFDSDYKGIVLDDIINRMLLAEQMTRGGDDDDDDDEEVKSLPVEHVDDDPFVDLSDVIESTAIDDPFSDLPVAEPSGEPTSTEQDTDFIDDIPVSNDDDPFVDAALPLID
jgi:hypothetical protein